MVSRNAKNKRIILHSIMFMKIMICKKMTIYGKDGGILRPIKMTENRAII